MISFVLVLVFCSIKILYLSFSFFFTFVFPFLCYFLFQLDIILRVIYFRLSVFNKINVGVLYQYIIWLIIRSFFKFFINKNSVSELFSKLSKSSSSWLSTSSNNTCILSFSALYLVFNNGFSYYLNSCFLLLVSVTS